MYITFRRGSNECWDIKDWCLSTFKDFYRESTFSVCIFVMDAVTIFGICLSQQIPVVGCTLALARRRSRSPPSEGGLSRRTDGRSRLRLRPRRRCRSEGRHCRWFARIAANNLVARENAHPTTQHIFPGLVPCCSSSRGATLSINSIKKTWI